MKSNTPLLLTFTACALLCSCAATHRSALVLDPVGPAPEFFGPVESKGTLLVYSAFATGVPSPALPDDFKAHTDYELRAEDGKLLQHIANQANSRSEEPAVVPLAPGHYQVVARANGFGVVTIPVVVAAGRLTELHLEGGSPRVNQKASAGDIRVCLPDGQVVGWQAVREMAKGTRAP